MDIRNTIYLFGVIAFGLFYGLIKSATGGGIWFLITAVCYLVALCF